MGTYIHKSFFVSFTTPQSKQFKIAYLGNLPGPFSGKLKFGKLYLFKIYISDFIIFSFMN